MVIQLHHQCDRRNVSPESLLLAHVHNIHPSFPGPIPDGTRVPRWAYIDTSVGTFPLPFAFSPQKYRRAVRLQADTWDISAAEGTGGAIGAPCAWYTHTYLSCLDSPEVTGTSLIVPTSTNLVSPSTTTPSSSSPTSTSQSNSKAGAIAGGVVGGVVGAALIAVVVAWFVVRRRHAGSPPSDKSGQGSEMGQSMPAPHPLGVDTPRLYVSEFFISFGGKTV